jgi:hypothetical protein
MGGRSVPAADVWSLGIMLHRVASGTGVYGDLSAGDGLLALRRVLSAPPQVSGALTEPVADLVRDCLGPAGQRPSATTFAARIDALT